MKEELFKLNEDTLCKLSTLDKRKVYIFNVEVGDMPKQQVYDHLSKLKEAVEKTGIAGIYTPMNNGVGCISITELKRYISHPTKHRKARLRKKLERR